jgi:hypothetical protein
MTLLDDEIAASEEKLQVLIDSNREIAAKDEKLQALREQLTLLQHCSEPAVSGTQPMERGESETSVQQKDVTPVCAQSEFNKHT